MQLSPIARLLYWDIERGSYAYDILCILIVVILLTVSPCWLGDPMAVCP